MGVGDGPALPEGEEEVVVRFLFSSGNVWDLGDLKGPAWGGGHYLAVSQDFVLLSKVWERHLNMLGQWRLLGGVGI